MFKDDQILEPLANVVVFHQKFLESIQQPFNRRRAP